MRLSLLALAGLFALSACETVGGAGRDIQYGGQVLSNTAQQVQNDF